MNLPSSQPGREIAPAVRRFDLPLGFVLGFVRANTSQKDRSHKRNFENQMTVTMINLPLISTTHFTLSPSTAFSQDRVSPVLYGLRMLHDSAVTYDVGDIVDVDISFLHSLLRVEPDLRIAFVPKLFDSLVGQPVVAGV